MCRQVEKGSRAEGETGREPHLDAARAKHRWAGSVGGRPARSHEGSAPARVEVDVLVDSSLALRLNRVLCQGGLEVKQTRVALEKGHSAARAGVAAATSAARQRLQRATLCGAQQRQQRTV